MKYSNGFALIEMLIVFAILMILGAVIFAPSKSEKNNETPQQAVQTV